MILFMGSDSRYGARLDISSRIWIKALFYILHIILQSTFQTRRKASKMDICLKIKKTRMPYDLEIEESRFK